IFAMNPDGSERQRLADFPGNEFTIDVSPDRTRILFGSEMDQPFSADILVMDVDGSNLRNLTAGGAGGQQAQGRWSPDGARIVYRSNQDGNFEIYVMDAEATNKRRLTNHPAVDQMPAWSPDGRQIVFQSHRNSMIGLYIMNADGTGLELVGEDIDLPDWSPARDKILGAAIVPGS
ncbi:MAG: TolB family protein, partial [Gemmatimonadales bacterium]